MSDSDIYALGCLIAEQRTFGNVEMAPLKARYMADNPIAFHYVGDCFAKLEILMQEIIVIGDKLIGDVFFDPAEEGELLDRYNTKVCSARAMRQEIDENFHAVCALDDEEKTQLILNDLQALKYLKERVIVLEEENKQLRDDGIKLERQATKAKGLTERLQNDRTRLEGDRARLFDDRRELEDEVEDLEDAYRSWKNRAMRLEDENQKFRDEGHELEHRFNTLLDDRDQLRSDLSSWNDWGREAEQDLQAKGGEISRLGDENSRLKTQNEQLREQNTRLSNQNEFLRNQAAAFARNADIPLYVLTPTLRDPTRARDGDDEPPEHDSTDILPRSITNAQNNLGSNIPKPDMELAPRGSTLTPKRDTPSVKNITLSLGAMMKNVDTSRARID